MPETSEAQDTTCPQPPADFVPTLVPPPPELFWEQFDFRIRSIATDAETVRFVSPGQDFVFCRGDRVWQIFPSTWKRAPEQDWESYSAELADPPFATIELDGRTYRYRVLLDPNPFSDVQGVRERAVFELQTPDSDALRRTVLYTQAEVERSGGLGMGIPRVTAAEITPAGDRLVWSIAFSQGEGDTGIATLASYTPGENALVLLQPEAIADQQITDVAIASTEIVAMLRP
ncbi:hypothetical protein [Rubidibacter lacunae]|uniref:hypothetical protein n=1 Tax=Rubidibacter lacunae TaxID=582514 RepID=UPI00042647F9|nr:hypothetical protein [Rubidibacter lacunae]